MDVPIRHDAFAGRGLALRTAGFFRGPCVIKPSVFDPIPKVQIGDDTIVLARPLAWYEYVWMGVPILLVFAGGGLGAMFGLFGVYSSARIFRSTRGTAAKYLLSALISVAVAAAFFVAAVIVQALIGPPSKA